MWWPFQGKNTRRDSCERCFNNGDGIDLGVGVPGTFVRNQAQQCAGRQGVSRASLKRALRRRRNGDREWSYDVKGKREMGNGVPEAPRWAKINRSPEMGGRKLDIDHTPSFLRARLRRLDRQAQPPALLSPRRCLRHLLHFSCCSI